MWVGELFAYVFKACTLSTLFNILLILALCCFSIIVGKKIYHSKGSILISICVLFAIVYLYTNNYWTFAQAYFVNVGYDSLLIISLLTLLITDIIAIARQRLSVKIDDMNESFQDDKKGYCMDEVYTKHRETGWGSYIEDLLTLMPIERLKKESLAIGISGKWGSGKTSFLKSMMESMKDAYLEISFNPWKCTDKVQIVSQFFTLMGKEVEGNDKPLEKAIQKYRDIVLDADIHPVLTLLAKILPGYKDEETLESLKNKVEEAISAEGVKPFVIFIDDLDRLEGDELFEVLRLIRVTANFRNMIFVVAYDCDYICDVLNRSQNIERAEEYIQKIFHLEVSLPKFEEETLLDVFMEEFSRIKSIEGENEIRFRQSILQLCNSAGVSFTDFIPNFRQARRFANIFALNLKAILSHTKDFVVCDFFGIELIHFAFPDVHHTLMYKPMTLLKQRSESLSKSKLLVYKGETNTPCEKLLKCLFSNVSDTRKTPKEIRSWISYANYFCYRLPKNSIGATEFEMIMIEDDLEVIRDRIHNWMQNQALANSLYNHFASYHMHEYKEIKVIRNYICALLEVIPKLTEKDIKNITSGRYWIRTETDTDELQGLLVPLFEDYIRNGKNLKNINYLLTSFCVSYLEGCEPDEIPLSLLDNNQLNKLSEESLAKFLQQNGIPSPNEISIKGSALNSFLMTGCYLDSYYSQGNQVIKSYSNLMWNELFKQYKGTEADVSTFLKFIDSYKIKTDNPIDEDEEAQIIKQAIESIFINFKNFDKFVRSTFKSNDKIEQSLTEVNNIMN